MRLAIADPPITSTALVRGRHAAAGREVDEAKPRIYTPTRPRYRSASLLEHLLDQFDGWAIATTPDGLEAYGPLPPSCRRLVWVKPNAIPGGHRIRSMWEAVILFPPIGRRNRRGGQVQDVLIAEAPRVGFAGAKPEAWTRWVLDALGYDPETDTVDDLFPGSGSVTQAIAQGVLA